MNAKLLDDEGHTRPGIYRLSEAVKNPKGDKRVRYDLAALSVWPRGTRFRVLRFGVYMGKFCEIRDPDALAALFEKAVPVSEWAGGAGETDRLDEILLRANDGVDPVSYTGHAHEVLARLLATGKVSREDVEETSRVIDAEGDEPARED